MHKHTAKQIMRIKSAPRGQAPLAIREQWIGVEIAYVSVGLPEGTIRGAMSLEEVAKHEVFVVEQNVAIDALRKKSREAADWWNRMGFPMPGTQFTFERECADIV
jgi:hypothetical protein